MESTVVSGIVLLGVVVFVVWSKYIVQEKEKKLNLPKRPRLNSIVHSDSVDANPQQDTVTVRLYDASNPEKRRKRKDPTPAIVKGELAHQKIFLYNSSSRYLTGPCHICLDQHYVFSIALDSEGNKHRSCLRCLFKYGGQEQIDLAMKSSRYAKILWESIAALDQLLKEFPDPQRRPYGEITLRKTIESTWGADYNSYRIVEKIKTKAWTEYDLARIEGRPEPPSKY